MDGEEQLRTFTLRRTEDVSGVSGTGTVAEGVEFHDGQVVLSWFGHHHTLEISPSVRDIMEIHGHGGKTIIEWTPVTSPVAEEFRRKMEAKE